MNNKILKCSIALSLCIILMFAGCAPLHPVDNTSQGYLMRVLDGGREKTFAYNAQGQIVNRFDFTTSQVLKPFDPWDAYFQNYNLPIWKDSNKLEYWLAGNFADYGWENAALISPGGAQITPAKYTDIWQIDDTHFLGATDETQLDFFDNTGAVYGTLSSFDAIDYAATDGMIRAGLASEATLTVGSKKYTLANGVSYLTPELKVVAQGYPDGFVYSDGLCAVYKDKYWGFIDKSGNMVIKPQFGEVVSFYSDVCSVATDDGMTLIDKSGNIIKEEYFDDILTMPSGVVGVRKGEKWGYRDLKLEPLGGTNYDILTPLSAGIGIAYTTDEEGTPNRCYAVDLSGREYAFAENMQVLEVYGEGCVTAFDINLQKVGVADLNGNWLLAPEYDDIVSSGNDMGAMVFNYSETGNDKIGYISKDFIPILPVKYTSIDYYDGKIFIAFDETKGYMLSNTGSVITEFSKASDIDPLAGGLDDTLYDSQSLESILAQ